MAMAAEVDVAVVPPGPVGMAGPRHPLAESLRPAVQKAGFCVVADAVEPSLLARMADEVRRELGQSHFDPVIGDRPFYGDHIQRAWDLAGKTPSLLECLATPVVDAINQLVLGDYCDHALLASATAHETYRQSGARSQPFHRDEEIYPAYLPRIPLGPEYTFTMMIAATDFTADNGATLLIPGSHLWPRGRLPTHEDTPVPLTMKKGSIAFWLGSTYHGAGVNITDEPRLGIIFSFCAGWLRTLENQFMLLDAESVSALPANVQRLLGWEPHGVLGQHDWRSPRAILNS